MALVYPAVIAAVKRRRNPILLRYDAGTDPRASGASFSRASVGTWVDNAGIVESAIANVPRYRHVENGVRTLLLEGSRTNLTSRGYLFGTNGVDGWSLTGDAAGVLSVVDDSAALATAGLAGIVTDGKVLKLDNSAGVTPCRAQNALGVANLNPHSVSAFVRGGSGSVNWANLQASKAIFGATANYTRRVNRGFTPTVTGGSLRVEADAGQVVYFVLPQLEEGAFESSPIPNSTAAALARSPDLIGWTIPDQPHAMEWVVGGLSHGQHAVAALGVAYLGNDAATGARVWIESTGTGYQIVHHNGTTQVTSAIVTSPAAGARLDFRAELYADGAVQLFLSVAGAPEIAGNKSAALAFAPAWGGQTFRLNSLGTSNQGNAAYISAQVTLP